MKNTNLKSFRKTINNLNQKQIAADRQIIENNFKIPDNALLIFDMFCRTPELDIATITSNLEKAHNNISRQAVTKIVDKLCGKKIKTEEDPKTGKKIQKEIDTGIRILSRIDGKGKHGAKYRYDAIKGSAADLAINTTQTQNADGLYLCFNGMEQARLQAETKTTAMFHPYKYHNKKTENAKSKHKLFIADNLEFMKAKMGEFEEKFDVLYFDVPYRMVNGVRCKESFNDDFDGTCDFLSFLLPRLMLAKKLLKPDGIIAVSIFEHEMHYLKCLMDSVYGRKNIVNNVVIKTSVTAGPVSGYTKHRLPVTKSYLLIYAKDKSKVDYLTKLYEPVNTKFTGGFNVVLTKTDYKNPLYTKTPLLDYLKQQPNVVKLFKKHNLEITTANISVLMDYDTEFEEWVYTDLAQKLFKKTKPFANPLTKRQNKRFNGPTGDVFEFGGRLLEKSSNGTVYEFKRFFDKLVKNEDGTMQNGYILGDIWDLTSEKSKIQKEGGVSFYSAKKPKKLLQLLLKLISGKISCKKCDEFLIGDFFAGSASTFDATLSMQDGIKRTCILCQIDEPVQPGSQEYNAGFRRIPQITIKRMKNVVKKYPGEGFQIFD